jgi:hypothetical protein
VQLRLLRCTLELDLTMQRQDEPVRREQTVQMWDLADGQWY